MIIRVAGWVVFVLATVAAARVGIGLAERISPPPAPQVSRFDRGAEFDEGAVSGEGLLLFASQQVLRDFEFNESLSAGSGDELHGKTGGVKPAPSRFRLKVEREDGRLVEVLFLEPVSMAGERWWIVADRLMAGPSKTMDSTES